MDLIEHIVKLTIELSGLMRILAITQMHRTIYRCTEMGTFAAIKIIEDSGVVTRGNGERLFGEPSTILDACLSALLVQKIHQRLVLSLGSYDYHILEVLGSGTNQRNAAYVYLFNDVRLACTARHRILERIKVYDDQVDFGYFILLHLRLVFSQPATPENTAENLRMQRFHAPAQKWKDKSSPLPRLDTDTLTLR